MTIDVDEGRKLLAEATPGPWHMLQLACELGRIAIGDPLKGEHLFKGSCPQEDARLIAWLRNNCERLLDAAEAQAALQKTIDAFADWTGPAELAVAEQEAEDRAIAAAVKLVRKAQDQPIERVLEHIADQIWRREALMATTKAGYRWRVLAHRDDGTPIGMSDDRRSQFDELVVDGWLHIEQMSARRWWMQIGGHHIDIEVKRGNKEATVFVRDPGVFLHEIAKGGGDDDRE